MNNNNNQSTDINHILEALKNINSLEMLQEITQIAIYKAITLEAKPEDTILFYRNLLKYTIERVAISHHHWLINKIMLNSIKDTELKIQRMLSEVYTEAFNDYVQHVQKLH